MKKFLLLLLTIIIGNLLYAQSSENHWNPDVNAYPTNMSVIAVVQLCGEEQRDDMIELGAFCVSDNELNGELRGSRRLTHIKTANGSVNRYMAHITIYGNAGDVITFKLYNHELKKELDYVTEQTITFTVDGTIGTNDLPYVINFDKFVADDESLAQLSPSDDVIVKAHLNVKNGSDVVVRTLKIYENSSLTIKEGGVLTVTGNITNNNAESLIIEEGGQLVHNNAGVAATFKNNIVIPSNDWGEDDNTGWQFVSSPVENVSTEDFIPVSGDYDLYMYDGTSETQWKNFKQMGSVTYDFSSNPFDNGWTSIVNGDGDGWKFQTKSKYMYSASADEDGNDIDIENYLISPLIKVNNTILSFKVSSRLGDNEYPETFKVLLSKESNTEVSDFAYVLGDYKITNSNFTSITIDLSDYAGNDVYIAFYHYLENVGSDRLSIDDVQFINDNRFEKGRGYLVSYESESVSEFKGNLNYLAAGESYQIDFNYYPEILAQFNLIGNPFVFDIDWETDVNVNNVYDGFATLDAEDGGYVYKDKGIIKAGEGFMVRTTEGNDNNIIFSRSSTRTYRKEYNGIDIMASNDKGSDNVIIRFDEEETAGFPKLRNFNENIASVYVKDKNINYGILNFSKDVNEIPLYFEAKEMGTYTLTFDIKGKVENLYLIDRLTGDKVNIIMEKEYTFVAKANDSAERFVLLANAQSLNSETQSNFVYVNNGELIINAKGSIQIIDMMGRVVLSEENGMAHINVSDLKNSAYIVRCVNDDEVKIQKIIL